MSFDDWRVELMRLVDLLLVTASGSPWEEVRRVYAQILTHSLTRPE